MHFQSRYCGPTRGYIFLKPVKRVAADKLDKAFAAMALSEIGTHNTYAVF